MHGTFSGVSVVNFGHLLTYKFNQREESHGRPPPSSQSSGNISPDRAGGPHKDPDPPDRAEGGRREAWSSLKNSPTYGTSKVKVAIKEISSHFSLMSPEAVDFFTAFISHGPQCSSLILATPSPSVMVAKAKSSRVENPI